MKLVSGLEVLEDREGSGRPATKGDEVVYNIRVFLNRGDEVLINESQAPQLPPAMLREVDGRMVVDHRIVLGSRHAFAGIEKALFGMQAAGYRKIRVSPHLAYRDRGVPGLIPANAVLLVEVWVREVKAGRRRPHR